MCNAVLIRESKDVVMGDIQKLKDNITALALVSRQHHLDIQSHKYATSQLPIAYKESIVKIQTKVLLTNNYREVRRRYFLPPFLIHDS